MSKSQKGEGFTQTTWLNWCRLCAKREGSDQGNSSIFVKNELGKPESELTTSIGKYFWVNIKPEDEISKRICEECRKLVEELTLFTERVNKVQTLYVLLQNLKPTSAACANKLRTQCGLVDEGWEHIIKPAKSKEVEKPKPQLKEQETQTDLMIYFNSGTREQNTKRKSPEKEPIKLREEIIKDLTKQLQDEYNNDNEDIDNEGEFIPNEEEQSEHTYEYILQDDGELGYIEKEQLNKREFKPQVLNMALEEMDEDIECEEEEEEAEAEEEDGEIHDSDLFKELKFKIEDEESQPKFSKKFKISSQQEDIELEYQESGENLTQNDTTEIGNEERHDQKVDYINNSESSNNGEQKYVDLSLLAARKRGRPSLSEKSIRSSLLAVRYECKECKRKYKNPNVYRKHMQNVHDVLIDKLPDFMCPECQKDCLTESRLRNHMRLHLPDDEKLLVPCPYCDKKFSQVGAMKQHVNGIHHQMKPFICDQCGRACKTMAALHEHQLVHTDECPFECEVCKKRFKNKPRLKSHMDTHTKSVYTCPECGLELNTRRTLLQHRLVHSDVKRFKCEFCDATFKRSKALKNHLILHSGLRPYVCNFCGKTFSNGSNCRAHKKRAHPSELAEEEAMGIKTTHQAQVPKLEELKSAKSALIQPRKIRRRGGLPNHLRTLLLAAENRKKQNNNETENYEYSDMHYETDENEIDDEGLEDNPELGEECEETVIYEIIDEI